MQIMKQANEDKLCCSKNNSNDYDLLNNLFDLQEHLGLDLYADLGDLLQGTVTQPTAFDVRNSTEATTVV